MLACCSKLHLLNRHYDVLSDPVGVAELDPDGLHEYRCDRHPQIRRVALNEMTYDSR